MAMGLALTLAGISEAQNPIDPYKYLATLEFDGEDFSLPTQVENVFPVRFDFNTTQDANNDGQINPEDNLENIIPYAIGYNITGTGRTGISNRGPNDQRPAVYYHYVDIYPWRVHQYWLYYADNDWLNNHEHDWEFYFVYTINGVPTHVGYSAHGLITIETWCNIQKDLYDPSHPRIGVDGGSHAMKNSDEDGVRIRFDGFIERRNGRLNFDTATIPWVIYSNDPNVINAVPYTQYPDTFWYEDPFYGGNEYGDPRQAPWLRTRWTNPEMPSGQPVVPNLPDTIYKCKGDTVTLDAGPGGSAYLWSTGETTQTIDVVTPGKYWVNVTSTADGCTYTIPDTVIVVDYPVPDTTLIIALDTTYKCYYQDSITIVADSGYIFYGWSTGDTGQSITVSMQGFYTVYVIDSFGCWWKDSTLVLERVYMPSFTGDTIFKCFNDTIILTAINGIFYQWNTGDTTQSVSVLYEGMYLVTATDSQGCIHPDTVYVANYPVGPVLLQDSFMLCSWNDSVIIGAFTHFLWYEWNTGDTLDSIVIYSPGEYIVQVVDSYSCRFFDTVFVYAYPQPNDIISQHYVSKCSEDTITIYANQGFVSYQWSTGDTAQAIMVQNPGTYVVLVTDTFGCAYVDSVIVRDTIYQHGVLFSGIGSDGKCYVAVTQNADSLVWEFDSVYLTTGDTACVPNSGMLCIYGFSLCYVDTFCSQVFVLSSDSDTVSSVPVVDVLMASQCDLVGVYDFTGRRVRELEKCSVTPCLLHFKCYNVKGREAQTIKMLITPYDKQTLLINNRSQKKDR